MVFYSDEEVVIALNESRLSKHAYIKVRTQIRDEER